MANELKVQIKNKRTYKDLIEIAKLCKESPEELLVRAFQEWVELREDLHDAELAESILAESNPADWVPIEDVIRDLEQRRRAKKPGKRVAKTAGSHGLLRR